MIKVVSGNVETNSQNYTVGGGTAFLTGDGIRITTDGEIELCDPTAAGSLHGIALADSTDYADGDKVPVALIDSSTVMAISCEAGNAPDDYVVGGTYGIVVASGAQTADLSATTGQLIITGKQEDDSWFDPNVSDSTDGVDQFVYCRVSQANIDTRIAASA